MSSPAVHGVLLDASPYPHPRSAILTPSSEASLNRHDEAAPSSCERHQGKRAGLAAMDDLLKAPITIKVGVCGVWRKLERLELLTRITSGSSPQPSRQAPSSTPHDALTSQASPSQLSRLDFTTGRSSPKSLLRVPGQDPRTRQSTWPSFLGPDRTQRIQTLSIRHRKTRQWLICCLQIGTLG